MDADRSGDQMTESAVDRELQAMLAVEPSPEFVARVRTRIASEPKPTAWWLSWKLAAGVAVAAVMVLAVVMARPKEAARSQPVERREASTDGARPTPPAAVTAEKPHAAQEQYVASAEQYVASAEQYVASAEQYVASAFRRTGRSALEGPAEAGRHVQPEGPAKAGHRRQESAAPKLAADPGERRREPEVLIDARESAALRALILGAREGRVDLAPVLRASMPSAMDLPPIGAIDIPFLTIDPITPGTGDEGVRQ